MKIGLLGCKGTTLDLLGGLLAAGVEVGQVVTLPADIAAKNRVAFYRGGEIADLCRRRGVTLHAARGYPLTATEDRDFFSAAGVDLLLVIGWERLLPDQVLRSLGLFACGMHGSPYGLPKGRGRSPMNWALITGHRRFVTYLFRYTPGVDDGDVIGSQVFDINEHDTIASLHHKNRVAMLQLVRAYLPRIADGTAVFTPQPPGQPTYYPKRTAEDGEIDFHRPTAEVHRFIRALAPPYPGAYCRRGDTRVVITAAQPFDSALFAPHAAPGTVLDVSLAGGTFVVKTLDGSLLVTGATGAEASQLTVGEVLAGADADDAIARCATRYDPGVTEAQQEIRLRSRARPIGG